MCHYHCEHVCPAKNLIRSQKRSCPLSSQCTQSPKCMMSLKTEVLFFFLKRSTREDRPKARVLVSVMADAEERLLKCVDKLQVSHLCVHAHTWTHSRIPSFLFPNPLCLSVLCVCLWLDNFNVASLCIIMSVRMHVAVSVYLLCLVHLFLNPALSSSTPSFAISWFQFEKPTRRICLTRTGKHQNSLSRARACARSLSRHTRINTQLRAHPQN